MTRICDMSYVCPRASPTARPISTPPYTMLENTPNTAIGSTWRKWAILMQVTIMKIETSENAAFATPANSMR